MQRYIFIRVLQTIVALWAVSIIVFALARITGNPLDTLLSFESTEEDRVRVAKAGDWTSLCTLSTSPS